MADEHRSSEVGRSGPRVVIAHDYLTQRGGAERVVLALLEAFPGSRIVTSVYAPETTYPEFANYAVSTSWLSRVSAFRKDPRRALPFMAPVWSNTHVSDADVVLCSTSGWSHGVRTAAPKIVYCHNPARWLYQSPDYLEGASLLARAAVRIAGPALRRWDQRQAAEAQAYIANSTTVARRVLASYGRTARIIHPPVGLNAGPLEPVPGIEPGYLLAVGRSRGYKNTLLVAQAVEAMPNERLVAVGGLPSGSWSDRLRGLTNVTDAQLRWLYTNADALVACAYEDFGLTPIEAYNVGTPALVLHAGGYLDTTVPGVSGEFIYAADCESIVDAVRRFRSQSYPAPKIKDHALSFSIDEFVDQMQNLVFGVLANGEPGVGGESKTSAASAPK